MPLPYCTVEDIRRKLDLPPDGFDGAERERFNARAEQTSQRWDSTTGSPLRTVRKGATEAPRTWEYVDAHGLRRGPPVSINLAHDEINPIDRAQGDRIEVRTGRDTFTDITDEEGDEYSVVYRDGQLKLYRFLINRLRFEAQDERLVRLTYRHGGLGGDRESGATTTLTAEVSDADTTLSVTDSARLPPAPLVLLVGESAATAEYVRVTNIDRQADDLTVSRGIRQTIPVSHDIGAAVQYTPVDVREAVAAKAAETLTLDDDVRTSIPDDGQLSSRTNRADRFRDEWDSTTAQYQSVRTL
jgi:hypothetical protein